MRKRYRLIPIAAALLLSISSEASAQVSVERFERQLEQIRQDTRVRADQNIPADQRTFVDFGAYASFNYLSLDDPALDNRGMRQYDLTAYAHVNLDGAHDFFVRAHGLYRDFNPGDAFDTEGSGTDGRLDRLYYRFDLARYLESTSGKPSNGDIALKVGRDLAFWANGLTLSQELDGVVADFQLGQTALQIIAGRTPSDSVDIDSSRPNFDDHTNRAFYGALLSTRIGTHRPYIYGLVQRDHNSDDESTLDLGGTSITTQYDYNSEYFGIGSTGALTDRLAYGIEAVFETGDTLSTSITPNGSGGVSQAAQARDDICAWAFDVQIDYLLPDIRHTRFSGELFLASGDSDRLSSTNTLGGNKSGTKDNSFNGFGLINTGLAFATAPSNLIVLRGSVSQFPFPQIQPLRRMQLGTDLFVFAKLNQNGAIDEPTTDDRMLGYESDLFLNWQMTSDVSLALRYGAFFPGDAIISDGKIRQFIYAGVTYAF